MIMQRVSKYAVRYAGLYLVLSVLGISAAHAELRDVVNELRNGGCAARSKLAPDRKSTRLNSSHSS